MSQERTWQTAKSEEEFIDDIVEGALHEIENDNDISNRFQQTKYENELSESYDPKGRYGNPLVNMSHNSIEDKPVPPGTSDHLKKADTLYEGVATATKSGIEKMSHDDDRNLSDYGTDILFQHIVGMMEEIARRIQIQPWANQTDAIFFNNPIYITSVQN